MKHCHQNVRTGENLWHSQFRLLVPVNVSFRRLIDYHRLDECDVVHELILGGREQTDAEICGMLMKMARYDDNTLAFDALDAILRTLQRFRWIFRDKMIRIFVGMLLLRYDWRQAH